MLTILGIYIPSKGLSAPYSTTFTFIAPALFSSAIWRKAEKTFVTSVAGETYKIQHIKAISIYYRTKY